MASGRRSVIATLGKRKLIYHYDEVKESRSIIELPQHRIPPAHPQVFRCCPVHPFSACTVLNRGDSHSVGYHGQNKTIPIRNP